jgi:hypothetical protein
VQLSGRDARITFGDGVGQFGTRDFTVAFGIKVLHNHGDNELNIIGNRNVSGHGNWFSLRLANRLQLVFEVDENGKGKNYVRASSPKLEQMRDQRWHHVALVRNNRRIAIYLDGVEVVQALSKTGVANIDSSVEMKLGHWTRHTPTARYEDLRIYESALSATQVAALVPPNERPLREGEIELVADDAAALVVSENLVDLSLYSNGFQRLRLGANTGATLFSKRDYLGVAQKLYSDIPNIRLSKLKAFPQSIKTWSSIGDPFTGGWTVLLPDGRFLGDGRDRLGIAIKRFASTYFKFHYNLELNRIQLVGALERSYGPLRLEAGGESFALFVDLTAGSTNEFAIQNSLGQWLALASGERPAPPFRWTDAESDRLLLRRGTKFANHEGEVGELLTGEVAVYEHVMYAGRTWVLSANSESGVFSDLRDFHDLHDIASSIRLGPGTGATLFRHVGFRVTEENQREEEIEDIFENVPSLLESQIGNNALSSIKIVKSLSPDEVFESVTAKLSQDYRLVDGEMEEFSAYRTILRLKPDFVGEVEVSATDFTEIEVDGTIHEIDEVTPVRLKPNEIKRLMITSEADGLDTPGLKFRTDDMAANEIVVIFPNKEAQRQIVDMEEGALWNATDAKGELIVDQKAHSEAEVAAVQRTMQRVMASVVHPEAGTKPNSNAPSKFSSAEPVVDGPRVGQAWELQLKPDQDGVDATEVTAGGTAPNKEIKGQEIEPDTWAELVSRATLVDEDDAFDEPLPKVLAVSAVEASLLKTAKVSSQRRRRRRGRLGRRFRNAIRKATRVVVGIVKDPIGAVRDLVNIIVETAEGLLKFVIDTARKVAEFIEAVVEKVVKAVKQFIEFLQFLFDWGDILKTKDYLARSFNDALDFGVEMADKAKDHTTAFVNDLQQTVRRQMDSLIRDLGGNPSAAPDANDDLPEALEWILSKLFGSKQKSGTEQRSGENDTSDSASPIERFIRHLLEATTDVVAAAGSLGEGVAEALQTFLKNPGNPGLALAELVEGIRDAVIHLLDAGENITLALLDVVELVVTLLKRILNFDFRIPFISQLFKFIGAGKLSILNVTCLLLAIPTTITHKIIFKERPFADNAPLEFSVLEDVKADGSIGQRAPQQILQARETEQQPALNSPAPTGPADDDGGSKARSVPNLRTFKGFGVLALVANALQGTVFNLVLNTNIEGGAADKTAEKSPLMGFVELGSFLMDVFIWIPTIPGLLKIGFFKDASASEKAVFFIRTFQLALDGAILIYGWFFREDRNTQRMIRADEDTIMLYSVLSSVELITVLARSKELLEAEQDDSNVGIKAAAAEFFTVFPKPFAVMRMGPSGAFSFMAINFACTAAVLVSGGLLLRNDVDAIEAASG